MLLSLINNINIEGFNIHPFMLLFLFFMVGLAAFVDSIAGGGGLISLPAYLIAGFPPLVASATNKLSATFGATMSFFRYLKKGFVDFKLAIPATICAIIGCTLGTNVAAHLDENILKICMIIILPIAMFIVLKKDTFNDKKAEKKINDKNIIICNIISLTIGFYDGFYGPGTGTFLIILFTKIAKLKLDTANGVAKTINYATNITAMVVFLFYGKTLIIIGVICGIASLIGSYIGTKLYIDNGAKIVKPIMLSVLVLFFVSLICEQVMKCM